MAIDNLKMIDGITVDEGNNFVCLLIADHLPWRGEHIILSEREHIKLLGKKIDAYMDYLESGQYKETYPNKEFDSALIEIHFRYPFPDTCKIFLESIQKQIVNNGVLLEIHVG